MPGRPCEVGEPRNKVLVIRVTEAERRSFKRAGIDINWHVRSIARGILRDHASDAEFPRVSPSAMSRRGTIYFALAPKLKRVKIGFTSGRVEKRLVSIQVGCPEKIVIIGAVKGSMSREEELHRKFESHRVIGEWFEYADELKEYIDSVCGRVAA